MSDSKVFRKASLPILPGPEKAPMSGGGTLMNPLCTKEHSVKTLFVQSVSLNMDFRN